MHHSVYDGWSFSKTLELVAGVLANNSPLPKATPMSRFIRYLGRQDKQSTKTFWQAHFDDTQLPTFPLSPTPSHKARPTEFAQLTISDVKTQGGLVSQAMLLRGAWAILLSIFTAREDVLVNIVSSGRVDSEVLDVLAPTVTSFPVRVKVQPQTGIRDFLSGLQKQAADMMPFEHTGWQTIRRMVPNTLGSNYEAGHLFTVQAASETPGQEDLIQSSGLVGPESSAEDFHSYGFNLECTVGIGSITLEAWYDCAVVSAKQVEELLSQFEHIYRSLTLYNNNSSIPSQAGKVELATKDIDLLSEQSLESIMQENSRVPASLDVCIDELVLRRAGRQPTSQAVEAWDGCLSYSELAHSANVLAEHLVSLGAGPEVMVGVSTQRSKWAIVALLAVLRSGAAVVPLGAHCTLTQLQTVAHDASIAVALVDEQQHERLLPARNEVNLVKVTAASFSRLPSHETNDEKEPLSGVEPGNAAWVIYSSNGKGIILTHQSLATSIKTHGAALGYGASTRQLQFAAHTNHVSIQEVFTTLCYGGCVCVPPEGEHIRDLAKSIRELRASALTLTPTLSNFISPSSVPLVDKLVLTGEMAHPAAVKPWVKAAAVYNAYGPRESSVYASLCGPVKESDSISNIGRPLESLFWVVNPTNSDQLMPPGTPGELLIEGPLCARGYLNVSEKAASEFIVNPPFLKSLDATAGRRMYRTGDLVHANLDGSFTYLGRKDARSENVGPREHRHQVEEYILRHLPEACVVSVDLISHDPPRSESEHDSTRKTLTAMIQFNNHIQHAASKHQHAELLLPTTPDLKRTFRLLRQSLADMLPSHMVPLAYVAISETPLDASGRADWPKLEALIRPELSGRWDEFTYEETVTVGSPKTNQEDMLRSAWASVLGIEANTISREADFFHLGGDSIAAMRLVAHLRALGSSLSTLSIFQNPSLAGMAELVSDNDGADTQEGPLIISPRLDLGDAGDTVDPDAFLSDIVCPAVGSSKEDIVHVFPATDFQAYSIAGNLMNSPLELYHFLWTHDGPVDLEAIQNACHRMIDRTECLRTRYMIHGNTVLQVVLRSPATSIEVLDTDLTVAEFATSFADDTGFGPVSLGQPPIHVAIIQSRRANQHGILLRMSHAAYDGVSTSMLWRELEASYSNKLQEAPVPFSQYHSAIRALDRSVSVQYWRDLLAGASMPQIGCVAPHSRSQPSTMTTLNISKLQWPTSFLPGITPSIILKSAWALVVSTHIGSNDVTFGEIVSGRSQVSATTANAVGCCVAGIPVRVALGRLKTTQDLLDMVRSQQLSSSSHESTGMETILRDCVDWPRTLSFSSYLNHQTASVPSLTLGHRSYAFSVVGTDKSRTFADVAVTSFQHRDRIEVNFSYATDSLSRSTAQHLSNALLHTAEMMLAAPGTTLQDLQHGIAQKLGPTPASPNTGAIDHVDHSKSRLSSNRIKKMVHEAWRSLHPQDPQAQAESTKGIHPSSKQRASLTEAAYLASHLKRQNVQVSVEEILSERF